MIGLVYSIILSTLFAQSLTITHSFIVQYSKQLQDDLLFRRNYHNILHKLAGSAINMDKQLIGVDL
jgi:hypothetical protein